MTLTKKCWRKEPTEKKIEPSALKLLLQGEKMKIWSCCQNIDNFAEWNNQSNYHLTYRNFNIGFNRESRRRPHRKIDTPPPLKRLCSITARNQYLVGCSNICHGRTSNLYIDAHFLVTLEPDQSSVILTIRCTSATQGYANFYYHCKTPNELEKIHVSPSDFSWRR